MSNDIDRNDVVWIVVANNNSWGASNSLHEAMQNTNLPEPKSPAEFFSEELEYSYDLGSAVKNWNEYGREEAGMSSDTLIVIIHRFDPGLWSDYSVSPIDGSVSFFRKEGMEADWDAEMKKATIVAEYQDGVLKPKAT